MPVKTFYYGVHYFAEPVVYLLRADDGTYKIGMSRQPYERKRILQKQHGCKLEVLHVIFSDNARWLEYALHTHLHQAGVAVAGRGTEWYRLTDEQVRVFLDTQAVTMGDPKSHCPARVTFFSRLVLPKSTRKPYETPIHPITSVRNFECWRKWPLLDVSY